MSVKAKDIKGFHLPKIEMDFYGESTLPFNQTCVDVGFNNAINQQGERSLTLDRESLVHVLGQAYGMNKNSHKVVDVDLMMDICDLLIANLPKLLIAEEK